MPSTYSPLKIQLMATGENNTTWGDITNLNLGTALEEAIVGSADVTFASADVTLTLTDTNTSQTARNMRLRCTGTTGGSTRNLIVPSIEKPYIVKNDCADSVVVKTAAGTGITVPAGKTTWVYSDATNVVDGTTHLSSLTLGTDLAVPDGGTGASTFTANGVIYGNTTSALLATAAGTTGQVLVGNTGAAPSWATLTGIGVTSFSAGTTGLTPNSATTGAITLGGTLGVANGGTGATTLSSGYLVKGNGTSAVSASVVYDDGTNVGIGTSSPGTKLMAYGASGTAISLNNAATGTTSTSGFQLQTGSGGDAYIWNYSNSFIAIATSNAERMRIDASGQVGIGTTPATGYKLFVAGDVRISNAGAETGALQISQESTQALIQTRYSQPLIFGTAVTERMRIDASGNVLINRSSTSGYGKFNVDGGADFTGGNVLFCRDTGNVGIGTASPAEKLTVQVNTGTSGFEGGITLTNGVDANLFSYVTGTAATDKRALITVGATAQSLAFGTLYNERMRILADGNVLVGRTTAYVQPYRMVVNGDSGAIAIPMAINDDRSGTADSRILAFLRGGTETGYITSTNNTLAIAGSTTLTFQTVSSEQMRITNTGNVGIGTSSPNNRLVLENGGLTVMFSGSPTLNLTNAFMHVVGNPSTAGSFRLGMGWNVGFDGTNWRTGGDGANNGGAYIATNYGAGALDFYTVGATGGSSQTISDASFAAMKRMSIDASGNVGIGTASPSSFSGYTSLTVNNATNGGLIEATNGTRTIRMQSQASGSALVGTTTSHNLGIMSAGVERVTVDTSGNVGIGVTPSAWGGSTPPIQILRASLWGAANNSYQGSNYYYDGSNRRYIGSDFAAEYAQLTGNHVWYTAASGTAGAVVSFSERMRIDSSGNLLVGTTSTTPGQTGIIMQPAVAGSIGVVDICHANGVATGNPYQRYYYNATEIGSISQNGTTAVAYNTSSDYRLKDIDGPVANSGAYIDALNPVQGSWKADGSRFIGLLAHEVQEVSETPIATGEKDGEKMQAMDYSAPELIANLIAEIQSLRARVAQLEGN